jgi:RNA polymerase sigma-70 factor (sigma-E family)
MTGDVRATSFDEAFPALAATGYRVAYRLLGDRSEAEDVAQEAVARAYARWRHVQPHAEPWVARVASNLALDALRRRGRRGTASIDASSSAEPSVADRASVDRIELARLLRSLPRRQREVVVLRYLADRSEADTALALGTSVGSVKRHAHRGLAALRTAWTGLEPEPLLDPGGA